MAFWGIEIKPGKPYIHLYDNESGRLRISQATLGNGSSAKRTVVQCSVGDKNPIYLCSLLPEKLETCALNLEFDENDEEVTFSVAGEHSVHLSGFFYGETDEQENSDGDFDLDSYGEGIMGTDSEDDSVYDSEDEDEDDDFTDDDDLDMYGSSPIPKSGVRIEEIVDEEKPTDDNGMSKRAKKKKVQSGKSDDKENSNRQIVVKSGTGVPILESEDEDGFPISARDKTNVSKSEAKLEDTNNEKTQKKNEKDGVASGKVLKRKLEADGQAGETARENIEPHDSSVKPDSAVPEKEKQKKNKKKKVTEKMESAQGSGTPKSNGSEQPQVTETENDLKPSSEKTKEKKKKNQKKQQETAATPNAEDKLTDKKGEETGNAKGKSLQVRTFSNGLMIEELKMGRPDGKRASPGKKVSVHYVGKLKNDKIFDSNIGRAPFKFRLGIGQVIKGWDVGVNGMRVGDKRRLTIPPSMGYGAKGCPGAIPPNSWLVFEVELVDVN